MTQELIQVQGIELADWANYIHSSHTDEIKQQLIFKFDNGYGASVVRGPYTYGGDSGLFELAVIKFDGNRHDLVYDTPITNDVLTTSSGSVLA